MPSGEVRHGRRSRHPQAHPQLSVRPRRARAGALPRQRLHAVRPPLRRTLGTSAADRREGRGRGALALAPRWLAASGRFRGGRHAARPRPPEPHHQSILPGPTADLQLNTLSYRCISATPVAVNFSYLYQLAKRITHPDCEDVANIRDLPCDGWSRLSASWYY